MRNGDTVGMVSGLIGTVSDIGPSCIEGSDCFRLTETTGNVGDTWYCAEGDVVRVLNQILCSWCDQAGDLRIGTDGWMDIACIDHMREYFNPNTIHPHNWDHVPVGQAWRGV